MDQVYIPNKDYKVLVRCMTYNQSKYIEDALNGFAMQQTDFPFVCLVMDDCSTDGEQDVIKAWMEHECYMENAENIEIEKSFITLVPHKTNANCHFAFYFLKENLYKKGGKAPMLAPWREHCVYEALCEGDDYWIHSSKLQLQYSYMESHESYSMVHTRFTFLKEQTGSFYEDEVANRDIERVQKLKLDKGECVLNNNFYRIQTATVLIRISSLVKSMKLCEGEDYLFLMGDTQMWLNLYYYGDIGYIPIKTAIYRVHANSACRPSRIENAMRFALSCAEQRLYYAKKFHYDERVFYKRYLWALLRYRFYNPDYKPDKRIDMVNKGLFEYILFSKICVCLVKGLYFSRAKFRR